MNSLNIKYQIFNTLYCLKSQQLSVVIGFVLVNNEICFKRTINCKFMKYSVISLLYCLLIALYISFDTDGIQNLEALLIHYWTTSWEYRLTLLHGYWVLGGSQMQKNLGWISTEANPITFGYKNYQKKFQVSRCTGSAAPRPLFFNQINKGFPKFIKEILFRMSFQFLPLKITL